VAGHIKVEEHGGIAVVRLDRPPANALDPALVAEGREVLERLVGAEPDAVVMTGRPGFFSAGVDLKVTPTLGPAGQREMVGRINRLLSGWYAFPRPLVTAVNGHAIAGGLILALCGDYRVGATEGKLGLTELRVGIPYPAVPMAIVKAELSPPVVRRLAMRADLVEPAVALELGLVDELADENAVLPRALAVAAELASMPSTAYAQVKKQVRGTAAREMQRVVEEGDDPMIAAWLSQETAEAASSLLRRDG
jgi:enoyl-CoA hydratase